MRTMIGKSANGLCFFVFLLLLYFIFLSVSSFYFQYLVSFQAFIKEQTCTKQHITAFWINSFTLHSFFLKNNHIFGSMVNFIWSTNTAAKQNSSSKEKQESCAGLDRTSPLTDFATNFDMFHILSRWENPCCSEVMIPLLFMRSLQQTFTTLPQLLQEHFTMMGNIRPDLSTCQTSCELQ